MNGLNKQKVRFHYGKGQCELELPAENLLKPLKKPNTVDCNLKKLLKIRLEQNDILKGKIETFPKNGEVVLIADDYTRPTPTRTILPVIVNFLNENGINDNQITLITASGFHREMSTREKEAKYGKDILKRIKYVYHNASDDNNLTYLGETSTGIPAYVNKSVLHGALTIGIGVIEIHPWAGFSGGGKIVSPGIAGKTTIDYTHSLPILKPNVQIGRTDGNPFWESCLEISQMAKLDLLLNVVLNINEQPAGVFFGDVEEVQRTGIKFFKDNNRISFARRADIVITTANPKHQSFGQALIAGYNAARVVREGGIRIVLADCPEGFGDSDFEKLYYYDALVRDWGGPLDFWEKRKGEKAKNSRNACAFFRHLELIEKSQLLYVTEGFPDFASDLNSLKVFKTPQEALEHAFAELGSKASIITFDLGGMILPSLDV